MDELKEFKKAANNLADAVGNSPSPFAGIRTEEYGEQVLNAAEVSAHAGYTSEDICNGIRLFTEAQRKSLMHTKGLYNNHQ